MPGVPQDQFHEEGGGAGEERECEGRRRAERTSPRADSSPSPLPEKQRHLAEPRSCFSRASERVLGSANKSGEAARERVTSVRLATMVHHATRTSRAQSPQGPRAVRCPASVCIADAGLHRRKDVRGRIGSATSGQSKGTRCGSGCDVQKGKSFDISRRVTNDLGRRHGGDN